MFVLVRSIGYSRATRKALYRFKTIVDVIVFLFSSGEDEKSSQLRLDSLFQLPLRLTNWLVAEMTFAAGLVHSLSAHPVSFFLHTMNPTFINLTSLLPPKVSIADRFFMGGPLDLRGYNYLSMGPSEPQLIPRPVYADAALRDERQQDPTCPVGALGSCISGFHLYSPLPLWGQAKDSMGSLFRLHAFAMAGKHHFY